jgi:membrane-associated protein
LLSDHGAKAIVLAPQIPYIRTLMPFVAGAMGYPWQGYVLLCGLGSLVWVVAITLVGFFLGELLPTWAIYALLFGLLTLVLLPTALKTYREFQAERLSPPPHQPIQTPPSQHEQ